MKLSKPEPAFSICREKNEVKNVKSAVLFDSVQIQIADNLLILLTCLMKKRPFKLLEAHFAKKMNMLQTKKSYCAYTVQKEHPDLCEQNANIYILHRT